MSDVDCVVAGGDPAALVCALLLARDGWRVRVVAPEARHSTRLGAISPFLSPPSLDVLGRIGLAGELVAAGRPVRQVVEHLADGNRHVLDHVPPALSVPLRTVTGMLHDALSREPAVSVTAGPPVTGVEATDDEVLVDFDDGGRLRAGFVVCADGKFSAVRELAGIDAEVVEFGRPLVMVIVPAPAGWPARIDAHHIGDRELVTVIPVAGDRLIVQWLAAPGVVADARADDVVEWCARIVRTVPFLAEPLAAAVTGWDRVLVVRHHVVRPRTWSVGRLVLLGDSAHGVHSFAGQAVNLGIQDAVALAGALRAAADPAAAFAAYERLRRPFVEGFQAYQLDTPQLSGSGAGHPSLYGGIADLMARGQPGLNVTWVTRH